MSLPMHRNKSVSSHDFAMVPRADIARSTFRRDFTHKTTFDAGYLIPVFVDEVLPGDSFSVDMTAFARLATPIFPVMDNLHLESFFFFVPNRLVWTNWVKFMGERDSPADSISYVIPQVVSPAGGYAVNSIFDYFGLPTAGQVGGGNTVSTSVLPLRAYNLICDEWFRDENLQNSYAIFPGDGPDAYGAYTLIRRGKRPDYFTTALPWPQKGGVAVTLPLGSTAPVISNNLNPTINGGGGTNRPFYTSGSTGLTTNPAPGSATNATWGNQTGMVADLSAATAATINSIRLAFQTQKLLERDARGGTRYTEIVRSHFGVISDDARLQRPEYLGGGTTPIIFNPIAQTSATGVTGGSTPVGTISGMASAVARNHGFTKSFTEHGHIIGIVSVRADLTYQQGVERFWFRSTRYDFFFPAFSAIGEQAILNREIYCDGSASDTAVFGYNEAWAEYRYKPSRISGLFRSTSAGTIDAWHLAQRFTSLPSLNSTFIQETPPVSRVVAVGASANGQQFIFDSFFRISCARPLPMYSVPGLIDHF
nr:MAG: major capsid protein [Microvirus sp.]